MGTLLLALVIYLGIRWLMFARVFHIVPQHSSLPARTTKWLLQLAAGLTLAVVLVALTLALPLIQGLYEFAPGVPDPPVPGDPLGAKTMQPGNFLFLMTTIAWSEELLFRGILMLLLVLLLGGLAKALVGREVVRSRTFLAILWLNAVVISSAAFSLVHGRNPGISELAYTNILLVGVMLGLSFIFTRGLTLAAAFHIGWNLLLEFINLPVSGVRFATSWHPFALATSNENIFTGGAFGPEASIGLTVVLLIIIAACLYTLPRVLHMHVAAMPKGIEPEQDTQTIQPKSGDGEDSDSGETA